MTAQPVAPAELLAELLETVPSDERRAIISWLLALGHPARLPEPGGSWPPATILAMTGTPQGEERVRRIAATLTSGEDSQLVTIRLPAERHAELRSWCAEHGFTMAAVVRGLVERFLSDQRDQPAAS